ncbi:GD12521 [Drosophila simulans]|uniref:GD12521 n=1 Tax=Drosophila simulans TaxID=7240 RepID=B4QLS8_DROSI|nr:GD12521 [Drosophila simulans]
MRGTTPHRHHRHGTITITITITITTTISNGISITISASSRCTKSSRPGSKGAAEPELISNYTLHSPGELGQRLGLRLGLGLGLKTVLVSGHGAE